MIRCARGLLLLLALGLAACAGYTTRVDYDRAVPLTEFTTYAWVLDDSAYQTLDQVRIKRTVDAGLAAKGMQRVALDQARLWVDMDYAVDRRYEVRSHMYGYYGWYPYWWGMEPDVYMQERDESTLTLLLINPATKAVVWTGQTVVRYYQDQPPAEREASLQEQVNVILQRFPPP